MLTSVSAPTSAMVTLVAKVAAVMLNAEISSKSCPPTRLASKLMIRSAPDPAPNWKVSLPSLAIIVSSPAPPLTLSSPIAPLRKSLPLPPDKMSLPSSPNSVSLPAPPLRMSLPRPPSRLSLPVPPLMVLASVLPLPTKLPTPI
ncbi:hypothetical protein D3C80_1746550 [compost metagenome]